MTTINEANRIEGLIYGEFFNVQLHNGDNPAIELNVDFTGMPVKTMAKLAYDTMKVKFRPHVKSMSTEAFLKAFNKQTVTWREMITKSGSGAKIALAEKSPEEIALEIRRLEALLETSNVNVDADADTNVNVNIETSNVETSNIETSNDISNDNYVPKVDTKANTNVDTNVDTKVD